MKIENYGKRYNVDVNKLAIFIIKYGVGDNGELGGYLPRIIELMKEKHGLKLCKTDDGFMISDPRNRFEHFQRYERSEIYNTIDTFVELCDLIREFSDVLKWDQKTLDNIKFQKSEPKNIKKRKRINEK